jgi:hypothetical protein
MLMGEVRREQMGAFLSILSADRGASRGRAGAPGEPLAVANRSACGKSEVGGIVDNKDFRLILERSLERSPPRLPPKEGRGLGRGGAGGAQPPARRRSRC